MKNLMRPCRSRATMALAALLPVWLISGATALAANASDCNSFARSFDAPELTLTSVNLVEETGRAAYCDVRGVIREKVSFAVYLPSTWNGRFVMVGNGGKAGSISLDDMAVRVEEGFATASTDTGHSNEKQDEAGSRFGSSREMEMDFAFRAVHDTAVMAKDMIAEYYGKNGPDYSYWVGCSQGGRQGLMEAQRFPTDFDGYVVGAPVYNYTSHQMTAPATMKVMYGGDPATHEPLFSEEELTRVGDAVYAKCDLQDGLKDGLLADPRQCNFDPAKDLVQCGDGETGDCFSTLQIDALQTMYGGTFNSEGDLIVPGILPGSERMNRGWSAYYTGPKPLKHRVMTGAFESLMFKEDITDPDYEYVRDFDFDADPQKLAYMGKAYDADDPDLRAVDLLGGKIIMYHGFADPSVNPKNTIAYRQAVIDFMESQGEENPLERANSFLRLYMIPGMGHCRGGVPGYNDVDFLTPLMAWVENAKAPEGLVGTRPTDGATRLHCPFPEVAYNGSGDPDNAESFACGK